MKRTAALIGKLIRLTNGETLPASTLKGDWFEQMRADGMLIAITRGSRVSFKAVNSDTFRHYLESQFDIRDLEAEYNLLLADDVDRATQVEITGDSKFTQRRTFTGFLVNSFVPIDATLNNRHITINPVEGSFLFISDYQNFNIPIDVVVAGIENAENFRYINRQRYLFQPFEKILFVSRYPQEQHGDLLRWLKSIPNQYVHFGDLDLAGIAIYQNEFYKHLGRRSSFLIPNDYETRIANGKMDRYNSQLPQYGKMEAVDNRIETLLSCIHKYHRGYDQEGFIK